LRSSSRSYPLHAAFGRVVDEKVPTVEPVDQRRKVIQLPTPGLRSTELWDGPTAVGLTWSNEKIGSAGAAPGTTIITASIFPMQRAKGAVRTSFMPVWPAMQRHAQSYCCVTQSETAGMHRVARRRRPLIDQKMSTDVHRF
jgi:hypothetical protein